MPRRTKTSVTPPTEIKVRKDNGVITEIRKYRLITPLYGGGVEPEKADPVTVVRASEIRGHLRFWWRATRGGAPEFEGKLEKMRQREEEIWGSSGGEGKAGPSKVVISLIGKPNHGREVSKAKDNKGRTVDYGDVKSPYGYVAFPLRKTNEKSAGAVREGVSFSLEIRYPARYKEDVQAALWAWETFGGIGARTRRGFGALQRMDIKNTTTTSQAEREIRKGVTRHVVQNGRWPHGVPHLAENPRISITRARSSAKDAWHALFDALKAFRQTKARYDRKSGKQSSYGLSRWPEANAIRKFMGLSPRFPVNVSRKVIQKFPRARFGLPIGFEMHHDGDQKLELQGIEKQGIEKDKYDRLASPLILRPLACTDGAVGLALILEWDPVDSDEPYTPPGGLRLKGSGIDKPVKSRLTTDEAKQIPVLNGETDVLQAFLDYVKGK